MGSLLGLSDTFQLGSSTISWWRSDTELHREDLGAWCILQTPAKDTELRIPAHHRHEIWSKWFLQHLFPEGGLVCSDLVEISGKYATRCLSTASMGGKTREHHVEEHPPISLRSMERCDEPRRRHTSGRFLLRRTPWNRKWMARLFCKTLQDHFPQPMGSSLPFLLPLPLQFQGRYCPQST